MTGLQVALPVLRPEVFLPQGTEGGWYFHSSRTRYRLGMSVREAKVLAQSGKETMTLDWHCLLPQADLPHLQKLNVQVPCSLFINLS